MTIYNRIKDLASIRKISIRELENSLGFSNGTIRTWGNNAKSSNLEKVANFFNVSTDYLLGRSLPDGFSSFVQSVVTRGEVDGFLGALSFTEIALKSGYIVDDEKISEYRKKFDDLTLNSKSLLHYDMTMLAILEIQALYEKDNVKNVKEYQKRLSKIKSVLDDFYHYEIDFPQIVPDAKKD